MAVKSEFFDTESRNPRTRLAVSVELMRELVHHHVVATRRVAAFAQNVILRQDRRAAINRLSLGDPVGEFVILPAIFPLGRAEIRRVNHN